MTRRRLPQERTRKESEFVWTSEIFEEAKASYLDGKSAQTIAQDIGCKTRNQVIGKMHRAGVTKRIEPRAPKLTVPKREVPLQMKIRTIGPPIVHEDSPELGLTILQLRPFHAEITSCRWPIGGTGAEMKFCGRTTRGRPYCKTCRALATNPQTAKQRNYSMRGALWAASK